MEKNIAQLITTLGIILMVIFGIVWVSGGAASSDFDNLHLAVTLGLLGLIGQLGYMIKDLQTSLDNQEVGTK